MKKLNTFAVIAILLCLFQSTSIKAQFTLINGLTCGDVEIGYEIGEPPPLLNCGVCDAGTITVFNGNSANLPDCSGAGYTRICIWIISIDNTAVGSGNSCHNDCGAAFNCCMQSCNGGNTPATSCSSGAPYSITIVPGSSWQIN